MFLRHVSSGPAVASLRQGRHLVHVLSMLVVAWSVATAQVDPNPPSQTTRLLFIHHSVGENWLNPEQGGLLAALNQNHYYVFDTNYDWGPVDQDVNDGSNVGTHTDIGHWYNWFLGPHRDTYMNAVYHNSLLTDWMTNDAAMQDPGGENNIILFKTCFTNGQIFSGSVLDAPLPKGTQNPLYGTGIDIDASAYTVSNIKGLYRDLLDYFSTRKDKLFILITSPPSVSGVNDDGMRLLRGVNNWLYQYWLANYPYRNVAVFDFGAVLTSNGGNVNTNDVGATSGSHHRYRNGAVEHMLGTSPFLAYGQFDASTNDWDNHPTAAGSQKGTAEFLPILNIAYNQWRAASPVERLHDAVPGTGISVSPQPASDGVRIGWSQPGTGTVRYQVFDLHGRVVTQGALPDAHIGQHFITWDTRVCPDGVYFFRVSGTTFSEHGKILVRH
jgi:hypothetical protein